MKSILIYIAFTLSLGIMPGCKKFTEIDPPKTQLVSKSVFENNETANSAICNVYGQMMDATMPYFIPLYTGIAGDELDSYSTFRGEQQLYTNEINSADAITNDLWSKGYNYIYQANAVIEGCEASSGLSANVKTQLIAEAKFIRAFWNFYLMSLYGPIPIISTTDYTISEKVSRSAKQDVYQQIRADLKFSIADLKENYVGPDAVTSSNERVRPNKYCAIALLSRVCLYQGDYAEAERNATILINQRSMYETVGLDAVFLKNSKEAIWQLVPISPNYNQINTPEGNGFILTTLPQTYGMNSSTISAGLLSSFEQEDQRKVHWIGKFTDTDVTPAVDYYFPYKYKVLSSTDISEYSMVFRLGEQYLIRAECRAKQGNMTGSIADVDVVRNRAGLVRIKDLYPDITADDLLSRILHERQAELFCEWGHRWMDLIRTGKINSVMGSYTPKKNATWSSFKQYFPIPQTDIRNNPNLIQNEGYN